MTDVHEKLLRMVDKMPAFSNSVHRILTMANDINCAPKDLVEVIEYDPVLTMKILKLVNSAYFGLSSKITSIKQPIIQKALMRRPLPVKSPLDASVTGLHLSKFCCCFLFQ